MLGTVRPPFSRCWRLSAFCRCMYRLHSMAWFSGTLLPLVSVRPMSTVSAPGPAKAFISFRWVLPVTSAKSFSPLMVISLCRRWPSFSILASFSIWPFFA